MVAVWRGWEAIESRGLQEFLYGPDVVCDSRLHGRRDAQSLMNAAEVEEGHIEIHGGFKMVNCFAESETQARKAPQMRPHAQIGAFDVRRANARFFRVSTDNDWNGCRDFRRLIPVWPFAITATVQLDQLSEVNVRPKILFDGGNVTAESIGCKLKASGNSLTGTPLYGHAKSDAGHYSLARRHEHTRRLPHNWRTSGNDSVFAPHRWRQVPKPPSGLRRGSENVELQPGQ
jgi:hypothetical protein